MYGEMEQVSPCETTITAGRRLCLPYALSALFPSDDACRGIARTGLGPYTMESIGRLAPVRFSFYGEDVVREGEYLPLLQSGDRTHCVGLSVGSSNFCTRYDSEWDFVMRCLLDMLQHPESLDLALVTPTEGGALTVHSHPSANTPLGGRQSKTNPYAVGGPTSIKRHLSGSESEDTSSGERIEPPRT